MAELLARLRAVLRRDEPAPGERPALEQRLLAVALAGQAGAALATSHPVDQG